MTIHGKDRVFISGVETLLQELNDGADAGLSNCVYVTCGMDIQEIYALFFRHPPEHYAIFITSERHFEAINCLFPGLLKLCLACFRPRTKALLICPIHLILPTPSNRS